MPYLYNQAERVDASMTPLTSVAPGCQVIAVRVPRNSTALTRVPS